MKLFLAALLAVVPVTAFSQDWDCSDAGNLPQQGMNYCAFEDWQNEDQTLNAIWPQVRQWAKERDEGSRDLEPDYAVIEENLLKAQRAWIDYRDGHCESEGLKYAGGSIQPLIVNSCKADLTRKRNEELLGFLAEG